MKSSAYSHILNPSSNRWVNINGKLGKQILKSYLTQLGGANMEAAAVSFMEEAMNANRGDIRSIQSMSFTPSISQIDNLISKAKEAENQLKHQQQPLAAAEAPPKNLLSKLHAMPFAASAGLLPNSANPDETILAKLGRGDIGPGGSIGDNNKIMTILDDVGMPYYGKSNGPNGVLTDCHKTYGKNRINLFYKDRESTNELLNDYLDFRDQYIEPIFDMFVNKLQFHRDSGYILQSTKPDGEKLHSDHIQDYNTLVQMFEIIKANSKNPEDSGISVVSYCQTWLRNKTKAMVGEAEVGAPQFSVMSPHFQTRFWIKDPTKLVSVPNLTKEHLQAYQRAVSRLDEDMARDYGGDDGQAFVNLDELRSNELSSFLNTFITISTSTEEPTAEEIKKYKTSFLLKEHAELNTSLEEFKTIVKNEGLETVWTATSVDDFDRTKEHHMILKVKKYNGVWETHMNAPIPITSIFDNEENIIYAAFPDPIKAYNFFLEVM